MDAADDRLVAAPVRHELPGAMAHEALVNHRIPGHLLDTRIRTRFFGIFF